MKHAQLQIRIVNALALHFGHHFAQDPSEIEEIFKIADLLTFREQARRREKLPRGMQRRIYESLINARSIMKPALYLGVSIEDWKILLPDDDEDAVYTWRTATGRYRVAVKPEFVHLSIQHTRGGTTEGALACGGRISLTDRWPYFRNVARDAEPRHVLYLLEMIRALTDVFDADVIADAQRQLLRSACKALGKDAMRKELEEAAEYAAENDGRWWIEAQYRDMIEVVDGVEL